MITKTTSTNKKRKPRRQADPLTKHVEGYLAELKAQGKPAGPEAFADAVRLFSQRFIESMLQGEMDNHFKGCSASSESSETAEATVEETKPNKRNGYGQKTIKTPLGPLPLTIPRDRNNTFQPIVILKHSRSFGQLDEQIITMYAHGMSTRDIEAFVENMYGVNLSADYISTVTDRVLDDIKAWQERPLENVYPVCFFDALRVKIRKGVSIKNMAVHLGIGVRTDGTREVLGMWIQENEGASFWAGVFNSLKARGVEDILIAVTDGLKGMTCTRRPCIKHASCT